MMRSHERSSTARRMRESQRGARGWIVIATFMATLLGESSEERSLMGPMKLVALRTRSRRVLLPRISAATERRGGPESAREAPGAACQLLRLRGGGVPKFYMWLSERYPLINHDVTSDVSMPEIDNLYLDMNGIIHPCTHGNSEQLVDLTQSEMFLKIFAFLDELVHIVKPQKLLFLAIDGVAPRAKMNQQRTRRFKAAKDLRDKLDKAHTRGGHIPMQPFDSNCITPGTEFMADLSDCLHYYIRYKVGCDSTWKAPTVILSGHEVPGEGEHKIMEYIRREKMQPGYPPNMRHCIYGNDADLIMLALASILKSPLHRELYIVNVLWH